MAMRVYSLLLLGTSALAEEIFPEHQVRVTNPKCNIKSCRTDPRGGGKSLLEISSMKRSMSMVHEPNKPLHINTKAEIPDGNHPINPDTGMSMYEVVWKPGHFTCLSCDPGTCAGCDVMCDLSSCIGQFYTTECWCEKDTSLRLKQPIWWFRKYDSRFLTNSIVYQMFCDPDCKGGICDTDGLQCKIRSEACKPWWWCTLPPPKKDNLYPKDGWEDGFAYVTTDDFFQITQTQTVESESHKALRRATRLRKSSTAKSMEHLHAEAHMHEATAEHLESARREMAHQNDRLKAAHTVATSKDPPLEPNDISQLDFRPGRFVCESGSLPPMVQNPQSRLYEERGYIVLDRNSCEGSLFDVSCYCYDQFKYISGEDPRVSELKCDESCSWGACEGKTCKSVPPVPLPPPTDPPPMDPVVANAIDSAVMPQFGNMMLPNK
eukprot:gnl/TRDRNA2_/TRDRNA2_194865_c0_seq1.p1 gnl/TRDRNA2_/TRDRNA2_194865_c0~~gnl/TRDRNA2_/TRDRNA2_194865_c0_seq1.p1  ORF type:complete len:435 (-),score=82.25 gnl/TRDRNA2_/TRDRNA2_194865_c0_seq1:116-1420(-)